MIFRPQEPLQIAYDGPALKKGRMPMLALGSALCGQALLIERVNFLLHHDSILVKVEVDETFQSGSLAAPLHVVMEALTTTEDVLAGKGFTALANLLAVVGFTGLNVVSLYAMFKRLKGRKVSDAGQVSTQIIIDVTVNQFITIYNDPQVQDHLRKVVDPLHERGCDEFQTRRGGRRAGLER